MHIITMSAHLLYATYTGKKRPVDQQWTRYLPSPVMERVLLRVQAGQNFEDFLRFVQKVAHSRVQAEQVPGQCLPQELPGKRRPRWNRGAP